MSQCLTCGSIGSHLRTCEDAPTGQAIGRRKRRRSADDRRWFDAESARRQSDCRGMCEAPGCRRSGVQAHHVLLVQTCHARGYKWAFIDRRDNLRWLCWQCHQRVHSGHGRDWAIENDLLAG